MGYSHILKDSSGKASGYRECDGEVAFMPAQQSYENIFRQVKIDIDTMVVLNHDFIKDKQRVYRRGVLLRGIIPDDFHVYNIVYIGNHQVIYTPYGDAKIVHPATFQVLDNWKHDSIFPYSYGRDKEFAYFFTGSTDTRHAIKLKACQNPDTFCALSNQYAKDNKHVFHAGTVLKKADSETFVVLDKFYARDGKHVYYANRLIEADAKTFAVLQDGYANDCKHLFFNGFIEKGEANSQ